MNRINCRFSLKYNDEDYNCKKKLTRFPVKHIEIKGENEKTPELSCGTNTFTSTNTIIRMFGTLPTANSLYGPTDFRKAMVDRWLDFEMNELEVTIGVLTFPAFKKIRENKVSKESKKDLKNKLKIIEEELKHHKYLIDDELSFADISLVCDLWNVFKMILTEKERNELPVLTKYFQTCLSINEIHDVLGDITYFATQNELNKKKKKQGTEVAQKGEDDIKTEKREIEIKKTYPEYDENGVNKNAIKLSTKLSYNYTRKRMYIKDIYNINDLIIDNNEIKVSGWIESVKESEDKNVIVVDINDGSYSDYLSVNIDKSKITEDMKIKINSTIEVKGILMKSEGNIRMNVNEIISLSKNSGDLPINKDDVNSIQSVYHLRPRNKIFGNIMKIRNSCSFATHLFYNQHGFVYINPPIITSNKTTSTGSKFNVTTLFNDKTKQIKTTKEGKVDFTEDFFKREVILCQSNELSIEPFCLSLGDVYSFNPVFTTNTEEEDELSERWFVTVEMSFVEIEDLMNICEDYVKYSLCYVIEKNENELKNVESKINTFNKIILNPFKRIDYKEIKESESKKEDEKGVFIFHKPIDKNQFYVKTDIDNEYSYSFDIILPEIGVIGEGYMKEDRIELLEDRMKENGFDENTMKWYLDLRKYGNTNHGGFRICFDKFIKYIVGMKNIKDVIPYPRWKDNLSY